MYLKTQLYDAISLQDKEKEAQLYETMRCVSIFNEVECNKLLRHLKKDYIRRICYMTYLTKSKQNLLYSLNLVEISNCVEKAKRSENFNSGSTSFFRALFASTVLYTAMVNGKPSSI